MASVTKRLSEIKQPRGGYLNLKDFEFKQLNDNKELKEENVHSTIVGLTVDYLTRFLLEKEKNSSKDIKYIKQKAFEYSILGYLIKCDIVDEAELADDNANEVDMISLFEKINGLDAESIVAACKATTYDVWYRNPFGALSSTSAKYINPDKDTIENIKIMVERSIEFWKKYGPVTINGFTFNNDAFSKTVTAADGDYLTKDTIWDFKVSRNKPTSKHTLQLLMYWIMGKHSKEQEFENITKLGIFNPRLNQVYLYDTTNLSESIVKEVEDKVICY